MTYPATTCRHTSRMFRCGKYNVPQEECVTREHISTTGRPYKHCLCCGRGIFLDKLGANGVCNGCRAVYYCPPLQLQPTVRSRWAS